MSERRPLHPERWEAEVSMPDAVAQPPEVVAVIGERGERLKGKLVKKVDPGLTAR